jgi:XRE family transcriptional regulator of biofilm formation
VPIDQELLGKQLADLRQRAGLSVSALAEKAGVAKSYLGKVEKGEVDNPGLATLDLIAKALNVTLDDLLNPPGPKSKHKARASSREPISRAFPESLKQFLANLEKQGENVPADVKRSLALLQFRGKQPDSADDWWFIYQAVKRSVNRR